MREELKGTSYGGLRRLRNASLESPIFMQLYWTYKFFQVISFVNFPEMKVVSVVWRQEE